MEASASATARARRRRGRRPRRARAHRARLRAAAAAGAADALSWPWQTCSEFGFYQTCPLGSRCPFVQGYHNVSDDLAMCSELFGLSPDAVAANVGFTNLYYGGAAPAASRVLFPNGDVDPWHALGVLRTAGANATEPTYTCYGCSHHFWTHPAAGSAATSTPPRGDRRPSTSASHGWGLPP